MIAPYGCIDEIIFTAVCDRQRHKIDAVFEPEIVVDPIVTVVEAIFLLGDVRDGDHDPVISIRIAYRYFAVDLRVLRSSKYSHMFVRDIGAGGDLQKVLVKRVRNGDRVLFKAGNEDLIFEQTRIFIVTYRCYRFFDTGLAKND